MTTHDDLRPPGPMLALLLRAAVASAEDGGPWLTAARSGDGQVTTHHIVVTREMPATPTRLTLLSGLDALGYAHHHRWTPAEVTDPSARQLRALAVHAMLHSDAETWDRDYTAWSEWRTSPERLAELDHHQEQAAAAARSLRWILAERWLSAR